MSIMLFLALVCLCAGLGAETLNTEVKNHFSSEAIFYGDSALPTAEAGITWKPELYSGYSPLPGLRLAGELSMDSRLRLVFDSDNSSQSMDASLYRAWLAASTVNTELKAGLQHIRMGVAQIYRPLQWFDQIRPDDPRAETEGVQALTLRHFFPNPELRIWLLPSADRLKGNEVLPSKADEWEFGGRLAWRNPLGESGFSYHQRMVAEPFSGNGIKEYRAAFDQRVDGFMGGWLESSLSVLDHGIGTSFLLFSTPEKLRLATTLGCDYTLGIGNGVYLLLEQYLQYEAAELGRLSNSQLHTALLMSYPLGLLDSMQLLGMYDLREDRLLGSLSWRRSYDLLSLELTLNLDSGYPAWQTQTPALHLRVNYDI